MVEPVISVLTSKSLETILKDGGTRSWSLNRPRAKACKYVVVCRNANRPDVEGPEAHGSAFVVGIVEDVVPAINDENRWLIRFSKYATCDYPDQWSGRNPVAYWTTDDYKKGDIDFDSLDFQPMPPQENVEVIPQQPKGLTIAGAKAGLSITFGVPVSGIEITIRG